MESSWEIELEKLRGIPDKNTVRKFRHTPTLTAQGILHGGDVLQTSKKKQSEVPLRGETQDEMTKLLLEQISAEGGNCESPLKKNQPQIGAFKERVGRWRWRPSVHRRRSYYPRLLPGDLIESPVEGSEFSKEPDSPKLKPSASIQHLRALKPNSPPGPTGEESVDSESSNDTRSPEFSEPNKFFTVQMFPNHPELVVQTTTFKSPDGKKKLPFQSHPRLTALTPQGKAMPIFMKQSCRGGRPVTRKSITTPGAICIEPDLVVSETPMKRKKPMAEKQGDIQKKKKFLRERRSRRKTWIPNAAPSDSDEEMETPPAELKSPFEFEEPPTFARPSTPLVKKSTIQPRTSPGKTKFNPIKRWPLLKRRMLNDGSVQPTRKPVPESSTVETPSNAQQLMGLSTNTWDNFKQKCQTMFPYIPHFEGKVQFFIIQCNQKKSDHCFFQFRYFGDDLCLAHSRSDFVSNISDEKSIMGEQKESVSYHYFHIHCQQKPAAVIRICRAGETAEIVEFHDNSKEAKIMDLVTEVLKLFDVDVCYFYDNDVGYPPSQTYNLEGAAMGHFQRFISEDMKTHWEKKYDFRLKFFMNWPVARAIERHQSPGRATPQGLLQSQVPKEIRDGVKKLRNWPLDDIRKWMRPEFYGKIERACKDYCSSRERFVSFKHNSRFMFRTKAPFIAQTTVFDVFQGIIESNAGVDKKTLREMYDVLLNPVNFKSRVQHFLMEKACRYEKILIELERARVYEIWNEELKQELGMK